MPRNEQRPSATAPLPSISFVDAVERACCTRPMIDLASVEHERDRPTGGGDRGGAGAAAAAAGKDAAQEVGAFGGDDAERAQRQPDGSGGGAAAAGRAHRHALPMDRAPSGRPAAGRRRGDAAVRRGGDPARRCRGRHGGPAPGPEQGLGPAPDAGAGRAGGGGGLAAGVAGGRAGGGGGRPLPLAWRVRTTQGSIGFAEQRELIASVAAWPPPGAKVVLMGDRFYGTPDLIA